MRERCAPVLDLPRHAPAVDYLARRAELGAAEVNRRFLRATGTSDFLLDGGFWPEALTGSVPVIYPFIVNDPGEAAQAKRRIGAVTIG